MSNIKLVSCKDNQDGKLVFIDDVFIGEIEKICRIGYQVDISNATCRKSVPMKLWTVQGFIDEKFALIFLKNLFDLPLSY